MNTQLEKLKIQVLSDVNAERERQDKKWGIQRHDYGTWLAILGEEYGEVCQAIQKSVGLVSFKETDADDLYNELVQVAAVAVAIAEHVRAEGAWILMEREEMITVLLLWTRFSEEYLRGLSKDKLEKLYQERVERG